MDVIYKLLNINYLNISRFAFQINPNRHSIFQDLDELIIEKESFTEYITFEYTTAIIYNIIVSIPSLIYFFSNYGHLYPGDVVSTIWILLVSFIKLLEIISKAVIIYQTVRIGNNGSDELVTSRRLKYMTNSNLFFFNTILGYALLFTYSFFFIFFNDSSYKKNSPQFYSILNWLFYGFFLRLIVSLVNYYLHSKYGMNEVDIEQTNFYKAYNNRVLKEVLELIPILELNSDNIKENIQVFENDEFDSCIICMLQFEIGDKVKTLPCNKRHIYHNDCIDKWLSSHKQCPTCRTEINLNLVNKYKAI